ITRFSLFRQLQPLRSSFIRLLTPGASTGRAASVQRYVTPSIDGREGFQPTFNFQINNVVVGCPTSVIPSTTER
ncbi:hypothetical protein GALMADRAFT_128144, partial [Galerina marginata CBS 339.88]